MGGGEIQKHSVIIRSKTNEATKNIFWIYFFKSFRFFHRIIVNNKLHAFFIIDNDSLKESKALKNKYLENVYRRFIGPGPDNKTLLPERKKYPTWSLSFNFCYSG